MAQVAIDSASLECLENGKKLSVQCRKKIMQVPVEVPVEQSMTISSTSEEEELKSNDTTSVIALGTGTPDMDMSFRVLFGLLNRLLILCYNFSEL